MPRLILTLILILCWTAAVILLCIAEEKLKVPAVIRGDITSLDKYMRARFTQSLSSHNLGSGGFALLHQGQIVDERGFGIANYATHAPVHTDSTLYLVSSLSKAVTAWGILKLVEEKKIGLDEPVLPYLKRWRFPGSDSYSARVTVRHLLSHTAGFVDGYGHSGFLNEADIESIEASLSGPADVNVGTSHPALLLFEPGTAMSYSSAGYAVLQLLVEEITGKPFDSFLSEAVLAPLGMRQSSYDLRKIIGEGRKAYLATSYDLALKPHPHRYYTNMAGVSLRASIHDLALLAKAYYGDNPVLKRESVQLFSTPQPATASGWGLGHTLYGTNTQGGFITGHGGGAFPASGAEMRINPATGNAIIILASGSQNLISELADDWTYWETGKKIFDIRNVVRKRGALAIVSIGLGWLVIIYWQVKNTRSRASSSFKPGS